MSGKTRRLRPAADLGTIQTFIAGEWRGGDRLVPILHPYDGREVGRVEETSLTDVDLAVEAARSAGPSWRKLPSYERAKILESITQALAEETEFFVEALVLETGKILSDARSEVARSISTLQFSCEEAKRIGGEVVPVDAVPAGRDKIGIAIRVPIGVVAGIVPFNAPLNLAIHKIGPALAAGCTMVVKPHTQGAALTASFISLCHQAGVPHGTINLVNGGPAVGARLVQHPGVALVNFTGSGRVGEEITRQAGLKKILMELGGTGPTIVHADADLDHAVPLCAEAAFGLSGQSCVSTQRLYVHRGRYSELVERIAAEARQRRIGDPFDPATTLGPLINVQAAERVESWVQQAVAQGATLVCGGRREGASFEASVLTNVSPDMKIVCEEVFGPVVSIIPYDTIDEAFAAANASPYGLKMGVFTNDMTVVMRAMTELEFGTVNINAPSRGRTDLEPSGGTKLSGWGKEGPRYAIEEMTYLRMISLSQGLRTASRRT